MRTTDKMENCILILYYYIIFTYLIYVSYFARSILYVDAFTSFNTHHTS